MTATGPWPSATTPRALARTLAGAGLAGGVLVVIAVCAYYNDPWRPLGHALGPWAVLAAAMGFGRPPRLGAAAGIATLAVGVVTFYIGLKVGHDLPWAGAGSVMFINWAMRAGALTSHLHFASVAA